MNNYNYEMLLEDLSIGREIEFRYKKNLYGIVHFSEGWFIVCNNKLMSEYYHDPIKLVETIVIDGKALKELFDSYEISDEDFSIF